MSSEWFHLLNLVSIAFFAISGALVAKDEDVDSFGMVVLAVITAVGGGTLRDVFLDEPVFWIASPDYLYSTYGALVFSIILIRLKSGMSNTLMLGFDAFGLALFNVIGIEKALINETNMTVAITLGTITAIFGGLLRDVVARKVPLVMRSELYATACIAGGLVYAGLLKIGVPYHWCILASLTTTISLRLGSLKWGWRIHFLKKSIP